MLLFDTGWMRGEFLNCQKWLRKKEHCLASFGYKEKIASKLPFVNSLDT
jgi:hypothetical protein